VSFAAANDTPSDLPLHQQRVAAGASADHGTGSALPSGQVVRPARPSAARRGPGTRARTQRDRILDWAIAGHVLHQDEWYNRGADGGSPIKAVRSRISELEADGFGFHHTRRDDGSVEYRLAHVPERPAAAAPGPLVESVSEADDVEEPLQLFDLPTAPALNAALTDWDAA
jgi:hypothetical protein